MRWKMVTLLCAALACAHPVFAQQSVDYASVSGRVADPQGGVIPGAHVSARQTATNVTAETVSDAAGRFRFPYLKVGPYELTVRIQGFADLTRMLHLTVGSAFDLPLTMTLAGLEESVSIGGDAAFIETARSQIAGTVPQAEIQTLPMNGRNFLDLALLIPGVSPTNVGSTQLFAETSAVPGQGISIASQRNLSNNFIVDGLSANDDAAGLSGVPYGVDAVEQFQVITSGGQAELGRALGRVRQRCHQERHERASRDGLRFHPRRQLQRVECALGTKLPMNQQQYGGEHWRTDWCETGHSISPTSSSGFSISPGWSRSFPRTSR